MFWILLAGAIGILTYYLIMKSLNYWTERGVKQGKPLLILGDTGRSLLGFASFENFLTEFYNKFPGTRYTGVYNFTTPTLMIKDPELLKEMTVKSFDHFTDHRAFTDVDTDPLFANNLLSLKGERWRNMRSTLSPSFTSSKMKIMFSLINEAAENFVNFFLKKDRDYFEIDMKDTCTRLTNDVIATAAFGIKVDSLANKTNEFYLMGKEVTDLGTLSKIFKLITYLISPKIYKILNMSFMSKASEMFFSSLINESIKMREEKGIIRPDMIHLLLEARKGITRTDEDEVIDTGFATAHESEIGKSGIKRAYITNSEITSQAIIFFFAGFDTVSTAMCFMTYELALNIDIQEKLRMEIRKTLKECDGGLTYEALLNMKYLDMVLSESLRKWPAILAMDRVCTKPFTIEPVTPEEKPVKIEKGTPLMLPFYCIHRDPNNYPEPERFNPERFSEQNKHNIKPFTYMPFGLGPRNCIGSRFALLEIKTLFFHLLTHFKIVPSKKLKVPLQYSKGTFNVAVEGGFWFELHRVKN